jgi:hypothetical protein
LKGGGVAPPSMNAADLQEDLAFIIGGAAAVVAVVVFVLFSTASTI